MLDLTEFIIGIIVGLIINVIVLIVLVPPLMKMYLKKVTQSIDPMKIASEMFGIDDEQFQEGMFGGEEEEEER